MYNVLHFYPINLQDSSYWQVLLNFLVTVKAAPHECVKRTGLLYTWVKAENEVRFYWKVNVSLYHNTSLVKLIII